MTVYRLGPELVFPRPEEAEPDGLLAVGGDLTPERLLLAYAEGIFPWYEEGLPILWHSPDPRMVLLPADLRVPRSLRKRLRQPPYRLTLDTAFDRVVEACAGVPRPGQTGTWITAEMRQAYASLFEFGYAHSVEAWDDDRLVGGLYGVSLGRCFFGESMFAATSNASKVSLVSLVRQVERWGFGLFDCQVYTHHMARFGATLWPRERFVERLARGLENETRRGAWRFDPDFDPVGGRP